MFRNTAFTRRFQVVRGIILWSASTLQINPKSNHGYPLPFYLFHLYIPKNFYALWNVPIRPSGRCPQPTLPRPRCPNRTLRTMAFRFTQPRSMDGSFMVYGIDFGAT